MNFRAKHGKRRGDLLLDMTPLIDVVFLLLIFFLITTTFIRDREDIVPISLPTGSAQPRTSDPGDSVTVHVDAQGSYVVSRSGVDGALQLTADELRRELTTYFETNPDLTVLLRGDRGGSYGSVMDVWMMAQEIGFQRVHAVVREPAGGGTEATPGAGAPGDIE